LERVKKRGILAFREVRDPSLNRKLEGWDGSTHTLKLLCKTQEGNESLRRYLQSRFSGAILRDINMHDYTPSGYTGIYELGYIGEVFSRAYDEAITKILLDRAPAPLIPRGPDTLPAEITELWTRMYSQDLFEYNRFPIIMATTSQGRLPFNVIEVTFRREALERMCLRRPLELNQDEYLGLLRFCLILCRLQRFRRAFRQRIYLSEGSIYPSVVRFISSTGRQLFEGIECRSNEMLRKSGNPSQEEFESIRWQPKTGLFALKVAEFPPAPRNKPTREDLCSEL
jgi:hypothetical protein